MDISVFNDQKIIDIDEKIIKMIEEVIKVTLDFEGITNDGEVSVQIVDNDNIKHLNNTYRNKDVETDVLSFPQYDNLLENFKGIDYIVMGDIVISAEKALEQAEEFGHSIVREFAYLTVHSMYHLLGFDHMEEEEKKIMRKKEENILSRMDIRR